MSYAYLETIIIPATMGAATSEIIIVPQDGTCMSVVGNGYAGSESATVEVYDLALDDWFPYKVNGVEQKLNEDTNVLDFYWTHAKYRISKTTTVADAGATLMQYKPNKLQQQY